MKDIENQIYVRVRYENRLFSRTFKFSFRLISLSVILESVFPSVDLVSQHCAGHQSLWVSNQVHSKNDVICETVVETTTPDEKLLLVHDINFT